MPRFRILTHDHPWLHWDLLLETDAALQTWRLLQEPSTPGEIGAQALPDHRKVYLEYTGPVSGGRGTVSEWDRGTFEVASQADSNYAIELRGHLLQGLFELFRGDAADDGDTTQWTFRRATRERVTDEL